MITVAQNRRIRVKTELESVGKILILLSNGLGIDTSVHSKFCDISATFERDMNIFESTPLNITSVEELVHALEFKDHISDGYVFAPYTSLLSPRSQQDIGKLIKPLCAGCDYSLETLMQSSLTGGGAPWQISWMECGSQTMTLSDQKLRIEMQVVLG